MRKIAVILIVILAAAVLLNGCIYVGSQKPKNREMIQPKEPPAEEPPPPGEAPPEEPPPEEPPPPGEAPPEEPPPEEPPPEEPPPEGPANIGEQIYIEGEVVSINNDIYTVQPPEGSQYRLRWSVKTAFDPGVTNHIVDVTNYIAVDAVVEEEGQAEMTYIYMNDTP